MLFKSTYESIIGTLTLVSDGDGLVALLMEKERYGEGLAERAVYNDELVVFKDAKAWLDRYFAGEKPDIEELNLKPEGTEFRHAVWRHLKEIPYGEVVTYGEIAEKIARELGKEKMSAQAVGGAVGHNPISIIVPCHRVIGRDGSLTGFGGGIDAKIRLLEHEGVELSKMYVPKKGTAL